MRVTLTLATLAALAGCAGPSPEIVKADDPFVTVSHPKGTPEAAAKEVARGYCRELGKRAAFLTDGCDEPRCAQRTVTYWCR